MLLFPFSLSISVAPAKANERYAAVIVDAATGEILFGRHMDEPRYPASLTKVMTLYVLFQELRAGRMTLKTPIVISKHAASMQPSKLGLPAGRSITVESAIQVLVTKSANDVAVAVGEAISGTETAFAARMTKTAHSLGMTRTTFRNASGLPHSGQITTARDLATLGLRLQRDFPEYYKYFGISSATVAGKTFRTHNGLIGKYKGTDGIKTGYINASGFNLLASVRRNGRHLVGVVMGGRTAASRNKHMQALFDDNFSKVPARRSYTVAAYAGAATSGASRRSFAAAPAQTAPVTPTAKPAETTAANPETNDVSGLTLAALVEQTATASPASANSIPIGSEAEVGRGELVRNDGSWQIQVGAFPTVSGAEQRLAKVRATGIKPLNGKPGFTEPAPGTQRPLYRARFSGFTQKTAQDACRALAKKSIDCLALSPQG